MIRRVRSLSLLPLALLLSACTTYVPVPYRPMADAGATPGACGNFEADSRYAPLRGRVALDNPAQQTETMLRDPGRPGRAERAALGEWRRASDQCRRTTIAAQRDAGVPEAQLALDTRLADDLDALTGQLAAGRISYGDFARQRQSLADGYNSASARVAGSGEGDAPRYYAAPPVYYGAPAPVYVAPPAYYYPPPYYYRPWYPAIGGSVWYGSGWRGHGHGRGGWGIGIGF